MRNLHLIAAGLAMGGMLLLAREDVPSPTVPVQLTVTVEARHGKEVPVMKPGDVMVFQKKERLQVTDVDPRAALELYILIDDASGMSLGSQLNDLKQFIETQPAETSIGIGYMRNGTVDVHRTAHGRSCKSSQRSAIAARLSRRDAESVSFAQRSDQTVAGERGTPRSSSGDERH